MLATFSEPLDSEAADPANFALSPNLAVTAAVQTEYQTQVLLTTTTQSAGTSYTLTVSNLRDRARNLIDAAARTASFQGISTELYLASANALSSTEVQLTFSEPMNRASLENVANYSFTDPDTDTDVDIRILSAVASVDNRRVVLTTTPQQNILYQVVATNIRGAEWRLLHRPDPQWRRVPGHPGAGQRAAAPGLRGEHGRHDDPAHVQRAAAPRGCGPCELRDLAVLDGDRRRADREPEPDPAHDRAAASGRRLHGHGPQRAGQSRQRDRGRELQQQHLRVCGCARDGRR